MKSSSKNLLALLAMTPMVLAAQVAQAENLLTNGSFENGLTAWQETCGTPGHSDCGAGIAWWWPSHVDGAQEFYGFDNDAVGVLSQSFATTPGEVYQLSFHYVTTDPGINTLRFGVDGYDAATPLAASTQWQALVDQFTAVGSSTTLAFYYTTIPGSGTLGLDGISVSAVPEPGAWALAAMGLGVCGLMARRQRKA